MHIKKAHSDDNEEQIGKRLKQTLVRGRKTAILPWVALRVTGTEKCWIVHFNDLTCVLMRH